MYANWTMERRELYTFMDESLFTQGMVLQQMTEGVEWENRLLQMDMLVN
jgi:hypothetical protein